ncbi:MAG: membrane protein insertase YidC [Phycisphaerales bacterium]|nr:membrane protein insertase YidC [Phycisphaerales bacterium]
MQNKDMLRALFWAALVFLAWQLIALRIWPPATPGAPPAASDVAPAAQNEPDGVDFALPPGPRVGAGAVTPAESIAAQLVTGEPATHHLGDTGGVGDRTYGLSLELSSVGASLESAALSDHSVSVNDDPPVPYPILATVVVPDGPTHRSFSTEKIHLLNAAMDVRLADVPWVVESSNATSVSYSTTIKDKDGTALLRCVKSFLLPDTGREPDRHDLSLSLTFENPAGRDESVIVTQWGAVGLPKADPRMDDRALFFGAAAEGEIRSSPGALTAGLKSELPLVESSADKPPVAWVAMANKFFVAFETFVRSDGKGFGGDWIERVQQVPLVMGTANGTEAALLMTTKPINVPAGQSRTLTMEVYLGPKSRQAFQQVESYRERGYDDMVVASYGVGSCCSFMAFRSLTVIMVSMLDWLYGLVRNYGVAIIILVLIVRTILHPVTKKGQVNMMRMQQNMSTLQPKMDELKAKYGNNKTKLNEEVMKMYRETGANPATGMISSCAPMFLQMPIWIALYTSLNFNIEMRHQPFVFWIRDLTAPDALIRFDEAVQLPLMGPVSGFNLLPILVGVFMFVQQKMMPKTKPPPGPPNAQAEQAAQMQKIMPYMSLVMSLIFYNMPSGLNLYIGASSLFGTIEQWRIRKHIERLKKLPPPAENLVAKKKPDGPHKPSFFEKLKKAAADAQKRQPEKKQGKR